MNGSRKPDNGKLVFKILAIFAAARLCEKAVGRVITPVRGSDCSAPPGFNLFRAEILPLGDRYNSRRLFT